MNQYKVRLLAPSRKIDKTTTVQAHSASDAVTVAMSKLGRNAAYQYSEAADAWFEIACVEA